ncbi:hypothetical protein [Myxococcus faecalis]|uniref:hypothetical protein n=1 Tax=Myxococcus faecalis TaxID=3115646 RepID=UPI003CF2F68A
MSFKTLDCAQRLPASRRAAAEECLSHKRTEEKVLNTFRHHGEQRFRPKVWNYNEEVLNAFRHHGERRSSHRRGVCS